MADPENIPEESALDALLKIFTGVLRNQPNQTVTVPLADCTIFDGENLRTILLESQHGPQMLEITLNKKGDDDEGSL